MDYDKLTDDELVKLQEEYQNKQEDLRMKAAYYDDEYYRIHDVLNARYEKLHPERCVEDPNAIIKRKYCNDLMTQINSQNRLISLLLNEEPTEKYNGKEIVINDDTEYKLGA